MTPSSLTKNTVYNTIRILSLIVFPLITFPYISRVLLPTNVGKINFSLSVVSYYSLIASLGITTYAIRECSAVRNDKEKLEDTASQIYSINIITTAVAYLALALTLAFYHKLDNYRALIIVQSLSIVATTIGADWLNSAMEDFRFITVRTLLFQILSIALMFIFVHNPEDYMKYALISLVSSAGANVVNIWYRRRYCRIGLILNIKEGIDWKRHFMPILLLFVMLLAQTIFHNVDSTMLGLQVGDAAVGIYSTAHKVYNLISQVVGSLLWVIIPRMSYYFAENNYEKINKLLKKVLGFNMLVGLPCTVGVIMLAKEIILILAGDEYLESIPVLRILMIGFAFTLVGGNFFGNAILLPSKQEKYYMIVCIFTAFANVITNYIFIPIGGVKAAAWTTALSELLILMLLLLKRNRMIVIRNIKNLIVSPLVGSGAIVAVCFLAQGIESLWLRTVVSVVISIIVYIVIQLTLKNELAIAVITSVRNHASRDSSTTMCNKQ